MQLSAPFLLILAALGAAEASLHNHHHRSPKHQAIARHNEPHGRRGTTGRCKPRPSSTSTTHSTTHTSTHTTPAATTTHAAPAALNNKDSASTTTKSSGNSNSSGGSVIGTANGLIKAVSSSCGSSGATKDITKTTGPNGSIDWLNCGVKDGGWNPPHVTVDDIVSVDLAKALQSSNTPFKACSAFIDTFYEASGTYGIPPILIASIAMQESSCNPSTVGGAGEQGLMQITKDKCGGAPGGNCKDPHFNIMEGTKFLSQTLSDNGGSLLLTIGQYNGWQKGMTVASATAAANTNCCRCQNNLDYLHQALNGWVQNVDPYQTNMGEFFNLNQCG
ncbi:lysozyme-like domain-containing protein [Lenzites betulinus]|nr:lysozyme-like domain-containing protein [Lenzites betulinus]